MKKSGAHSVKHSGLSETYGGHTLRMTAIFRPFLTPSPPSERKMTSLLLYTMTSLLLILTVFGRPPLPPSLRSSLKYPP